MLILLTAQIITCSYWYWLWGKTGETTKNYKFLLYPKILFSKLRDLLNCRGNLHVLAPIRAIFYRRAWKILIVWAVIQKIVHLRFFVKLWPLHYEFRKLPFWLTWSIESADFLSLLLTRSVGKEIKLLKNYFFLTAEKLFFFKKGQLSDPNNLLINAKFISW